MPRLDGIDVSHYQGQIDWTQVRSDAGIRLVSAKATEGVRNVDQKFAANWAAMRAAGFPYRFAYHFVTPDPPAAQAQHFVQTIGKLQPGEGVMLDIEWVNSATKPPTELETALVVELLAAVKAQTGRTPLRYMGEYYAGFNDPRLTAYPLWLAAYESALPKTPAPTIVWQWGGGNNGSFVSGIDGGKSRVDSNQVEDWDTVATLTGATA
jgi:lysozyme